MSAEIIKKSEEINKWIVKQKPNDAIFVMVRIALRITPLVIGLLKSKESKNKYLVLLTIFKTLLSSYLCSQANPKLEIKVRRSNTDILVKNFIESLVQLSKYNREISTNKTDVYADASRDAAAAAYTVSAVRNLANAILEETSDKSILEMMTYSAAAVDESHIRQSKILMKEVEADHEIVHQLTTSLHDVCIPLWKSNFEPDWSKTKWIELKKKLEKYKDEHWHVWTDWWEDRRDGKPYNIEMEREIVLIPEEDWQQGPAHVNAMIAEIRARYAALDVEEDIPADNPVAPRFETAGERIVLRAETPEAIPDDEQVALYDALREQAVELRGLCPENSNRYGAQGKAVGLFLTALGEGYGSMRLSTLWIAGQKMRRFARADEAKIAAADPEDDPMEPDQSALFDEVVTTYNVFSTGEPGLKAKDDKGRDVATLSPDVTGEAKDFRGAVVQTPAPFGDDVEPVLGEVLEEAEDPTPGIAARGVVMTRETFENLLSAIVRKAHSEPKPEPSEIGKGAKAALGTGIVAGTGVVGSTVGSAFIAYHQTTLIAYASKLESGPVWVEIIKKIAALWPAL